MNKLLIGVLIGIGLYIAYKVATYDFCEVYYGTTCLIVTDKLN